MSPATIYVTPGKHNLRIRWTTGSEWSTGHREFIAEARQTYLLDGEPSDRGGILFTMKTYKDGDEVPVHFQPLPE